jgi:putative sterol carrier protein
MEIPQTAKEIVFSSPMRFRKEKAEQEGYSAIVHLQLTGKDEGEGDFTVAIQKGEVTVSEGLIGVPSCVATMKASLYVDMEWDRTNPQMAFMLGKIKVSNPMEMIKFIGMFRNMKRQFGDV